MWRSRVATFATCCTGTGAELLNRDKGGLMSVDTQWATREEVAQDREKLSRLDEKIENSVRSIDRHSATQAGVEKAIDSVQFDIKSVQSDIKSVQSDIKSVQSDIKSVQIEQAGVKASLRWITWLLSIGFSTVIALLVAALVQFLRLVGGG